MAATRLKVLCMYCSSCNKRGLLTEKVACGGDAFLFTGFDNWKKAQEYFIQHEKSVIHREAVLKLELMKQPTAKYCGSARPEAEPRHATEAVIIIEISS